MLNHVMDLYIETLTGAAFELRVSPFETIMSVKAKIQRHEGELMVELDDNIINLVDSDSPITT